MLLYSCFKRYYIVKTETLGAFSELLLIAYMFFFN